jgi:valyl-tRNA synthetase
MHLKGDITLYHSGDKLLKEHGKLISTLARLSEVKEVRAGHGLHLTGTEVQCWLDVDQETIRSYLKKLGEKQSDQQKLVKQLEARLGNESYTKKAPKALVDQSKTQLEEAKQLLEKISEEIRRFSN